MSTSTHQALRMDPNILMHNGKHFDFYKPEEAEFDIQVVSHALSHICRFTGHTKEFYSVAQHSVLVSYLVPEDDAMTGLLHDGSEAFINDIAAPLKQLLPDYKAIEARVEQAVLERFGLPAKLPASVKQADLVALAIEQRDLMPESRWPSSSLDRFKRIKPLSPKAARSLFLMRYRQLIGREAA
jgi:hypothetical protein